MVRGLCGTSSSPVINSQDPDMENKEIIQQKTNVKPLKNSRSSASFFSKSFGKGLSISSRSLGSRKISKKLSTKTLMVSNRNLKINTNTDSEKDEEGDTEPITPNHFQRVKSMWISRKKSVDTGRTFFGSSMGSILGVGAGSSPSHGMSRAVSMANTECVNNVVRMNVENPFETALEGHEILTVNSNVRAAFIRFITKRAWVEGMVRKMKAAKSHQTTNVYNGIKFQEFSISPKTRRVSYEESADHFMERVNLIQRLKISATRDFGSVENAADNYDVLRFTSKEMISVVLATLYPLFLQSQEYETAVNIISEDLNPSDLVGSHPSQGSHDLVMEDLDSSSKSRHSFSRISALTSSLNTRLMSFRGGSPSGGTNSSISKSFHRVLSMSGGMTLSAKNTPEYRRIQYLYLDELDNTPTEELEPLLLSGEWVTDFLGAMNDMQMSLTISLAPKETSDGFEPHSLVFVNKAFESLTQHKRDDILGGCCKVLQSRCTEKEQINVMRHCIEHGQACKVAVCNVRKDKSEFVNFVALLPHYVSKAEYKYMIGLQYDASDPEASLRDIKMVDDYLLLVNNLLR